MNYEPYTHLSREEILERVSSHMSEKRYQHSLRVEAKILELAKLYPVDETKASLAAIVHDYAKERPLEELQQVVVTHHLNPKLQQQGSEILHGPSGAELIKEELGIEDEEILDAIREHTIGGMHMTLFSKLLFVADAIEDGRVYPGVDTARLMASDDIDAAVMYLVKHTLAYLIEKGVYIYPGTLEVYNQLIKES